MISTEGAAVAAAAAFAVPVNYVTDRELSRVLLFTENDSLSTG